MQRTLAQWHFTPDLIEARRLRLALDRVLQEHQVEHADDFLLACAELVVNLSRYPQPKPEHAELRFSRDEYFWQLELLDDGPSFSNFSQQLSCTEPLTAAEGGMGLKLLAASFDEFFYIPACYREDARNLMLLRQRIDTGRQLPQTLLLVDDDAAFQAVTAAYLTPQYRVIQAADVKQAFQLMLLHKPDLVVCDLSMPESDGPVLYDMIRHIPEVATTAFIYLSGCADEVLIERALSRPIDDFLHKPVTRQQLLESVSRALMRRQHLAEQIQRELEQKITLGLHPSLPGSIGGYRCALRTRLPEAGGGDLVLLKDSHLIFADLMGHGITAKGYVYALAGYMRGLCAAGLSLGMGVASLLEMVSRGFDEDPVLRETLATIMAVRLGDHGCITLANAGHPQPVLCRAGEVQRITVDGPLPGLLLDGYKEQSLQLLSGDRILLFSDGYLDAAESLSRTLEQQIIESCSMPLESAADYLMQYRPQLHNCPEQEESVDDVTLIVLEWPVSE